MRAQPIERFPLISRLKDYYEDADFKHNEIQDLRIELENIDIKELENCIRRFILLCDSAMTNAKGIAAISD